MSTSWAKIAASASPKSSMTSPTATASTTKPKLVAKLTLVAKPEPELVEASKPAASPWASPKPMASSKPESKVATTSGPPTPKSWAKTASDNKAKASPPLTPRATKTKPSAAEITPPATKVAPMGLPSPPPTPKMKKATPTPTPAPKSKSKKSTPCKDPFADLELVPKTSKAAVIFDVDRMEAELVAIKAAGIPSAYDEIHAREATAAMQKRKLGLVVQRGFDVREKVVMGGKVGIWGRTGK